MQANLVLAAINGIKNGKFFSLTKEKDYGNGVTKISRITYRLGVQPKNMKVYKDSGREPGGLPWGQWVKGLEGRVIEHKGSYYLRVAESHTPWASSQYYLNGNPITKEEAVAIVGEKKMSSGESPVYNIKFDNIVKIK